MSVSITDWRCTRPEMLRSKRNRLLIVALVTMILMIACAWVALKATQSQTKQAIEQHGANWWPYGIIFCVFAVLAFALFIFGLYVYNRIKEVDIRIDRWAAYMGEKK